MSKLQRHVQCYDAYAPLEMVQRCIREGHHVMILMRGIPGSGKTHLANSQSVESISREQKLRRARAIVLGDHSRVLSTRYHITNLSLHGSLLSDYGGVVCSTDDFFMKNGEYRFQPEKLEEYHRNNILRVREAMKDGIKPIIVDNTNIFANHMEQYAFHAVTHCYEIFVVEPQTSWKYVVKECSRRNVHGLDKTKIQAMLVSLKEQGRPSLSRLVGKGRQVRLEPPFDGLEIDFCEQLSSMSTASPAAQNKNVVSLNKSVIDRPPGLSLPNGVDVMAKLLSQNDVASLIRTSPSMSLSLAPDPHPCIRLATLRDMATQTNEVIVTLTCAGISCCVEDLVMGPSYTVERIKDSKIHMKDRVVKMENNLQPSELDVLVAVFPFEEVNNLIHYYQMLGFDDCVKLFVELGAYVDWSASVVEGAFVEELVAAEMSATCPHAPFPRTEWQRIAEQEGMIENSAAMPSTSAELPRTPSPQANSINVKLGVDILQKMNVLFGNGMVVDEECTLNIPVWLLEQLYLIWQGGAREEQREADAQLALLLQEDEDDEQTSWKTRKKLMTVAQKLNLAELMKEFSSCDPECVRRVFEDNKYDAAATRVTLLVMMNPNEEIEVLEQSPAPTMHSLKQATSTLLPRSHPPVRSEQAVFTAQKKALHYQRKADEFAEKRNSEIQKAQKYIHNGMIPAAVVYHQNAREHAAREKHLREKAADIIIKAHESSNFLDLHLLNQRDAMNLLKERLALLDRHESLRNGRSNRRLRVITGYGKNSGGRAVIKPAVESYLKRNGYVYCFTNMGEIVIHCK